MNARGCVFFIFGEAYMLRLLVSVHSLRQHYQGPITVFLSSHAEKSALEKNLERLSCNVVALPGVSKSWDRHRVFQKSPYESTLMFDSDLLFLGGIDELWQPLEQHGVLLTRFFPNPYGVEGTEQQPGWANRVGLLQPVEPLVDTDTYQRSRRRLIEERIDINVGVMGINRPRGLEFLDEWACCMELGRDSRVPLMDEMLAVALAAKHQHYLADELWNCPADEFFRRTNLADARIIHYFADNAELSRRPSVAGIRLGRNPLTWAGRKWYEMYGYARRDLDLKPFTSKDPGFRGLIRRQLYPGINRPLKLARGVAVGRLSAIWERLVRVLWLQNPWIPPSTSFFHRLLFTAGLRVKLNRDEKVTVVIMSYKRMNNISTIVQCALLCDFVDKVIVSNNNPEVDLESYLTIRDPRVELIQQSQRRGPSYRYDVARAYASEYYLCIDDDMFPTAWQLRKLFTCLLNSPSSTHGSGGQNNVNGKFLPVVAAGHSGVAVDVIVHIYAFTSAHLQRYFELLAKIGMDNEEVRHSEDVIISFAGTEKCQLQPLGVIHHCSTALDDDIATSKQRDFPEFRKRLLQNMKSLGAA